MRGRGRGQAKSGPAQAMADPGGGFVGGVAPVGPATLSARGQALLSAADQDRTRSMGYRELHAAAQGRSGAAVPAAPGACLTLGERCMQGASGFSRPSAHASQSPACSAAWQGCQAGASLLHEVPLDSGTFA